MTLTSDPVDPVHGPAVSSAAPGFPDADPPGADPAASVASTGLTDALPRTSPPAPDPGAGGAGSPEALIEEARRRQRHRWRWTGTAVLVLVAALVAGLVWAGGSGGRSPTPRATRPVGSGAGSVQVRSLAFPGPFSPEHIVSAAGKVWLVGSVPSSTLLTGCAVESVDPATLHTRRYPLPGGCGLHAVVGGGQIYLSSLTPVPGTNTNEVRIERFDPATGRATVLAPVDMTLSGSSAAHTAMAYGHGSLWLWGRAGGGNGAVGEQVVQISPSTGAVVRTITGVPEIGGTQPLMVAADGGLWLAGGAGSSATVDRLAWGATAPSVVYTGPAHGSVLWLAAAGSGRVWAAVTRYGDDGQGVMATHLVALDAAGHQVARTPPGPVSDTAPTGSGSQLWAVGSAGSTCADPLRLWRIDGTTGAGKAVVTLHTAGEPCLANAGVAIAGPDVFALVGGGGEATPAVLSRVTG